MREITYRNALNEGFWEEMKRDKTVIALGEDIAQRGDEYGGAFGVTKGLLDEFGPERVINTPISELSMAGIAVGAAAVGLRPVVEFMFNDFMLLACDQIINQMAKLRYMSGGQIKLPIVVRMPMGAGQSQAAQHSQCLYSVFINIPGIKIVCPSTPYDAKGIFKSAIRDQNPVLMFEHLKLYNLKGEVPAEEYCIPLGKADVKRKGDDLTIIAVSEMIHKSLKVAQIMEKKNISIEVVDPVSLVPLDTETIINSVKKTNKVIVAYNGPISGGVGCEIIARINELAFNFLDAPIYRVADKDTPNPFSPVLENYILAQEQNLIDTVAKIMNLNS